MIAQLAEMSESAQPTPFHHLLRALDDRGKLLRVYTQNIDALESKSGLTFGVPEIGGPRGKPKSKAGPSASQETPGRLPSPPLEIPRCIPLHGTLGTMHCVSCTHVFPLRDHLEHLNSGIPPYCPECTTLEKVRQMTGKRSRGVGKLRPSVVLYNEDHKDGEHVGEVVRKDLTGSSPRADLLLVVGTSLRVPGTKRIVREFSKAVRLRATKANANTNNPTAEGDLQTPTSSPRRTPVADEGPITSVYLNLDFPVPTRDWEGVFDVWLKGDAQQFATAIKAELEKADATKVAALERKRKREEAAAEAAALAALGEVYIEPQPKKQKLSKKKPSKPIQPSAPIPSPTNSDFASKSMAIPVSANVTRIDMLLSPSDEESDSSQRERLYVTIPGVGSRARYQAPFGPPPSLPEKHPRRVYQSPSSHGEKGILSQGGLKQTFPVTMGKPTAKLK